ncbi:MAG: hypothetical protein A2Z88_04915 [Omnitrophica WOR_2 bacterium GWA2_47_8]|nr:MAG: hypothetical protein A2Z88_04915 [Omnitrophica WOR_2 bacterium GWA2_47_8]
MVNKYTQQPDEVIDLHHRTTAETAQILQSLLRKKGPLHIRLIVGKGLHSKDGPILGSFVKKYLSSKNIAYKTAKLHDGGEGAIDVTL